MYLQPKLSYAFVEADSELRSPQASRNDVYKLLTCWRLYDLQHTSACRFDGPTISGRPWSIMEILELRSCMHLPEGWRRVRKREGT